MVSAVLLALTFTVMTFSLMSAGQTPLKADLQTHKGPKMVIADMEFRTEFHPFAKETTKKDYQEVGWYKIPKDTSTGRNWLTRTYLYVNKITVEEALANNIKVIDDIVLNWEGKFDPSDVMSVNIENPTWQGWKPATTESLEENGWKWRNNGCWVHYSEYSPESSISDIMLHYGHDWDDYRSDWEDVNELYNQRLDVFVLFFVKRGTRDAVVPEVTLRMNEHNKFKILQISDLHLTAQDTPCKDSFPQLQELHQKKELDPTKLSEKFIKEVIEIEHPDLVVLTGDQISGEESFDAETVVIHLANWFVEKQIPFATTFGAHDDKSNLSKDQIMQLLNEIPYSVSQAGPASIPGVGNYILNVFSSNVDSSKPELSLYFLDSEVGSNGKSFPGSGPIQQDQIQFMQSEYEKAPGTPGMAFFHRPLPEYRNGTVEMGSRRQPSSAPVVDCGVKDAFKSMNVNVVSVGADHTNDFCLLDDIWLCHGGVAGYGALTGEVDYARRVRLFEFDSANNSFATWQRLGVYSLQEEDLPSSYVPYDGHPSEDWCSFYRVTLDLSSQLERHTLVADGVTKSTVAEV